MWDVDSLRHEHREILLLVAQLTVVVRRRQPPNPVHLLRLRREMSRLVLGHMRRDHRTVLPELISCGSADAIVMAEQARKGLGDFIDRFADFAQSWTTERIESCWAGYREAALSTFAQLRTRIENEDCDLLQFLPPEAIPQSSPCSMRRAA